MNEDVMKEGASEIIKVVANALESAVTTYGPQAVDLAMTIYRIEAAQQLVYGFLAVAVFVLPQWLLIKKWWVVTEGDRKRGDDGIFWVPYTIISGVTLVAGIKGGFDLLYIPYWLALFGYPEVYMAVKALAAGGLM